MTVERLQNISIILTQSLRSFTICGTKQRVMEDLPGADVQFSMCCMTYAVWHVWHSEQLHMVSSLLRTGPMHLEICLAGETVAICRALNNSSQEGKGRAEVKQSR